MLTAGLMEGTIALAVLLLIAVGSADRNHLHRLLAPPVLITIGVVTGLIATAGAGLTAGDFAALSFFAVVGLLVPIFAMGYAFRLLREPVAPAPKAETPAQPEAIVTEHPRAREQRPAA